MRRRTWRRSAARTRFGRSITASFAASIAAACRSLPRRIVGAAASFFVCSARESMIEVVRASSSARSRKSSSNLQGRRRDQRAPSSSFGIPAPLATSQPAWSSPPAALHTRPASRSLLNCRWRSSCQTSGLRGDSNISTAAAAAAASAEARQRAALSSAELRVRAAPS